MKKKPNDRISSIPPPAKSKKNFNENLLDDIQRKLSSSSALNGGFDTLLFKIDKIEQGQGQLATKVDKIHEAIYDPNDGIFSKLSEYKIENNEKFNDVSQKMSELNEWKKHREKEDNKNDNEVDQTVEKLHTLEKSVDSLVQTKDSTWKLLKWFLVALGGGIVTLFFKWLETKIH